MTSPKTPDLLTVQEAAEELKLHKGTVYQLTWKGILPVIQLPGVRGVRIDRRDLNKFIRAGLRKNPGRPQKPKRGQKAKQGQS